jgi:hypothetical protein
MVNGWMGPRKYCLYGCFLVLLQIICVIFMNINDFSIVYSCFLWEKDDEGVVNRKQVWHHPVKPVQIWRPKIKTTTTMCQMLLHKPWLFTYGSYTEPSTSENDSQPNVNNQTFNYSSNFTQAPPPNLPRPILQSTPLPWGFKVFNNRRYFLNFRRYLKN